jgi:hypothetical protein
MVCKVDSSRYSKNKTKNVLAESNTDYFFHSFGNRKSEINVPSQLCSNTFSSVTILVEGLGEAQSYIQFTL